jgi:hypothetical protein
MHSNLVRALQTASLVAALMLGATAQAAAQNTCPAANPYDSVADDIPLQQCLDGGGTIALSPNASPGYILRWGLRIRVAGTILTTTTQQPQNYARLVADPALGSDGDGRLIMTDEFVNSWQLSYIWLDGNKSQRIAQSSGCSTDYRPQGINATLKGTGFVVKFSRFTNAMCGSGLEISGTNYEVYQNYFGENGRESGASQPWADGLTLLSCNGGYVHHNDFVNNTDVDIVLMASSGGCQIRWNYITHNAAFGFAGLHIGQAGVTNNVGGLVADNEIVASSNKLLFGINVGGQFWVGSLAMVPHVGRIEANRSTGAFANLVVDGVSNGVFTGNISQSPQGSSGTCGSPQSYTAAHIGGGMSVQPGSVPLSWLGGSCQAAPGPPAGSPVVSIASGGYLLPSQCVDSPSSTYRLCFQSDANFVLYAMPSWTPVWYTSTWSSPGAAIMQGDGNLVVYNSSWQPLWSSGTHGNPGAFLSLDAAGGMRVYSASSQLLWSR